MVSAIANQTGILRQCLLDLEQGQITAGDLNCSYALKWVAHFFGDLHQPLHTNARNVGGNTYRVIFANTTTQLHAVRNTPSAQIMTKLTVAGLGSIHTIFWCKSQQTF